MGVFLWVGWLLWAGLVLIIGTRHPRTWDGDAPIGTKRTVLAVVIALIFILSFIPDPVQGYNAFDLIKLL